MSFRNTMMGPKVETHPDAQKSRDSRILDDLFSTCQYVVEQKLGRSQVIDLTSSEGHKIPRFDRHEITNGRVIGRGGFAVIREITAIDLINDNGRRPSGSSRATASTEKSSTCQDAARDTIAKRVSSQKKELKYVLKELATNDKVSSNRNAFMNGVVDLAMEAQYLAHLSHPNILKLRGISTSNQFGGDDGMFLVLDYLPETLSRRLSAWAQKDRTTRGITGFVTRSRGKAAQLLLERLIVGRDIAYAMSYLHSNKIIFRDLKPDNLGFSIDNKIKLFDFGLAKELNDRDRDANGLYRNMTEHTGSTRYMAPEIGLGKRYNLAADVYSWSMLMWFVMALEPPLGLYTPKMMFDRVFQKGHRPVIGEKWPLPVRALLSQGWNGDIKKRPNIGQVADVMQGLIVELEQDKSSS